MLILEIKRRFASPKLYCSHKICATKGRTSCYLLFSINTRLTFILLNAVPVFLCRLFVILSRQEGSDKKKKKSTSSNM